MKELTSKEINVGLSKKGWGIEDFIKNYGYSDVEELKEALGKVFSNSRNVNQAIKSMKNNSKRNKRHSANTMPQVSDDEEDLMYTSAALDSMTVTLPPYTLNVTNAIEKAEENIQMYEASSQVDQKKISEMLGIAKNVSSIVESFSMETAKGTVLDAMFVEKSYQHSEVSETEVSENENQLEVLNNKLNLLNQQIISNESARKALYARRRANSKSVDEICQKLKELEAEVRNHRQMFEAAYSEYSDIEKSLEEEKVKFNELQQERENVMSQIRELTAISLYCGKLDNTDKSFDYKLSEQNVESCEINDKLKSFFEGELAESGLLDEFAVSALKLVAKIIIACEKIEEEASESVELWFDEPNDITELVELIGKKVRIVS